MTVLCDFFTIIGDGGGNGITVHPVDFEGESPLGDPFNTGGRIATDEAHAAESGRKEGGHSTAFLIYSVRNMTGTAQVFLNNSELPVGIITPSPPNSVWCTQMIAMAGFRLHDGDNQLTLKHVTDTFNIKDLICYFHQDSD
jgi:hypothetical protein